MTHPSLSPAVLADLRQQLLARQSALRADLQAVAHEALLEEPEPVADMEERAEERIEHAVANEASARAARELAETGAALARLAQGRYGTCLGCGQPIPEQRLLVMPATPFCARCQSLHEPAAHAVRGQAPSTGR